MTCTSKIRFAKCSFARCAKLTIFVALAFASLGSHLAFAQSSRQSNVQFPYQAMIRYDDTEILSGPADVHYATDKMEQGEIVQVYRHDPGGWCAIRPNDGSFSLIPAAAIKMVGDDIGEVTQDNTQAWVGTRLGSVEKPLWQIKLKAGEEVEILGEASWPSPDGNSTVWYQIAPPAGEFRWVALSALNVPPADTQPLASKPRKPKTNQPEQEKDSGFKYVGVSEEPPSNATAKTDNSGFKYLPPAKPEKLRSSPANAIANSDASSRPRSLVRENQENRENQAAWNEATPGRQKPRSSAAQHNSRLAASSTASRATTTPRRDDQGIDFKFRPIGQTAVNSGRFDSAPKDPIRDPIRRDSSVVPAAFQEPYIDNSRWNDGNSGRSNASSVVDDRWQQGRDEIAQRRSQYEARYDEFNSRSRTNQTGRFDSQGFASSNDSRGFVSRDLDHRDVEDSFGVRLEDLPSHRRRSSAPIYETIQPGSQYTTTIENAFPPGDRFASLGSFTDPIPHSPLAEKLTVRLAKVEEELTNEMLKRPNEWQLADLELNVGQIYSQTTAPVERLQAQRILDKIKKCKLIRNGYTKNFQATGEVFGTSVSALKNSRGSGSRGSGSRLTDAYGGTGAYDATGGSGTVSGSGTRSPLGATAGFETSPGIQQNNVVGSGIDTNFEAGAQFDASGWLTELVSEDRNNRPVYVLVNDSGKITHHVAGAPGLNMHRYLKSKVGVVGRRGYNNRMKLDHITAEAIDEIQRY